MIGVAAYKATKDASALGETFNAVNKVFGDSAGTITAFGEVASKEAGLSQRAFQQLATSTGSLLTNMGYSTDEAADSTVNLAKRAADMASVFDTDVDTALEAINSGLRGETEPLRQFGVSLSAAEVEAKALALGLDNGTGEIDKQAKALATEALILEQSSTAAGDFADTSDSMANAQRTMAADVENLSASFGEALLPVMEKFLEIGISIVGWISENQTAFQVLIGVVAALAAGILVASAAMKVWQTIALIVKAVNLVLGTSFTVALGPIALVIAAIVAVIAIGVLLYKNWDKISAFLRATWEKIKAAAVAVWNAIKRAFEVVFEAIATVIKAYVAIYVKVFTVAWDVIKRVFTVAFQFIKRVVTTYLNAYKVIFTTVFNVIKQVVTVVFDKIKQVIQAAIALIKRVIQTGLALVKALFSGDFDKVEQIVRSSIAAVVSLVRGLPGKILSALGNLGRLLYSKGRELVQGLIDGIKSVIGRVGSIFSGLNPFAAAYAVPGASGYSSGTSAATTAQASTRGNAGGAITINIYEARDGRNTAALVKRALEGYDVSQGRTIGAPLARAW